MEQKATISQRYVLCTKEGKKITLEYTEVSAFGEKGVFKVKLNGKIGFIDENGNEIIKPKYTNVQKLKSGFAEVRINGRCGYVDETGREIVPPEYDWVDEYDNGYFRVGLGEKYGYIDKTGKKVIPPVLEQ